MREEKIPAEMMLRNPLAEAVVRSYNSYTEVSPSGKGVKLWIRSSIHPTPPPVQQSSGSGPDGWRSAQVHSSEDLRGELGLRRPDGD